MPDVRQERAAVVGLVGKAGPLALTSPSVGICLCRRRLTLLADPERI